MKRAYDPVVKAWAEWSQVIDQSLAWYLELELTQIRLTKRGAEWEMMVKGNLKGKPVATFIRTGTYYDCWVLLGALVQRDHIKWYTDKYPPNMGA